MGEVYRVMVHGMQHCGSGPGPDSFGARPGTRQADSEHSMSVALERWVENGAAPVTIIAAKYESDRIVRTRPLCPYPQVARYSGTGSTTTPLASGASITNDGWRLRISTKGSRSLLSGREKFG
jgi:Tannase and feruloyl esterase